MMKSNLNIKYQRCWSIHEQPDQNNKISHYEVFVSRNMSENVFKFFLVENVLKSTLTTCILEITIVSFKAGTINRIVDKLTDKFHRNDNRYRFANNRSFYFHGSYFTVFTLSFQTPQLLTILNLKFE